MRYCSLFILLLAIVVLSCRRGSVASYSHPQYFDAILRNAAIIADSNKTRAHQYVDSCYNTFDRPGILDAYRKYAFFYDFTSHSGNEQLRYADSMIWAISDHLEEKEMAVYYGDALLKKGNALLFRRDFNQAFACISLGRAAIGQTKDPCLLSQYTFMLGTVSYMQARYADAIMLKKHGIAEAAACPGTYRLFQEVQAKLDDIGLAYGRLRMEDSALFYFDSTLRYLHRYAHPDSFPDIAFKNRFIEIASGVVYGNMGDVWARKGDTAKAIEMYTLGAWINGRHGYDHGDAQCSQLKLANLHIVMGQLPAAAEMLGRIRASLDSFPSREWEARWYRLRMDLAHKQGNDADVYPLMVAHTHISDSLARLNKMPTTDVNEEYHQRFMLEDLRKKNETTIQFLVAVAAFSVLALFTALLLLYYWKRTTRLNRRIREQNHELRLAMEALSESQQENTRMMQIVAHDLKNPIASMVSVTAILLENKHLDDDDRRMLALMKETNENAIDLITDLLNINTNAGDIKKEPVNADLLLRYCVDLLQFRAGEKEQRIELHTEAVTVQMNREKMWRVISNLIVNAVKFSQRGSAINVWGERQGAEFIIRVEDRGIGIPDGLRSRIFDMFTTAQRTGTGGEASSGIGLAISRRIVEAHGGRIWFESNDGGGTTFYVALPV